LAEAQLRPNWFITINGQWESVGTWNSWQTGRIKRRFLTASALADDIDEGPFAAPMGVSMPGVIHFGVYRFELKIASV
jgi:hypothetical protein